MTTLVLSEAAGATTEPSDAPMFFCGCAACSAFASLSQGGDIRAEVATGNQQIDGLAAYDPDVTSRGDQRWNFDAVIGTPFLVGGRVSTVGVGTGVNLTYSFMTAAPAYEAQTGFKAFNETERAATREALDQLSALTNLTFTEVADSDAARLRFGLGTTGFPDSGTGTQGYAYFPNWAFAINGAGNVTAAAATNQAGDVWLNAYDKGSARALGMYEGGFGRAVLLHEIGHAVGLQHGFNDGSGQTATLAASEQTAVFSVMNDGYRPAGAIQNYDAAATIAGSSYGYSFNGGSITVSPSTFQLRDIQTLQHLYGVNTTTRTGTDAYTLDRGDAKLITIYDAGGSDAIDASSQTRRSTINLDPGASGAFSSIGYVGSDLELRGLVSPLVASTPSADEWRWQNNLAIAAGTVIENAFGGANADAITGNAAGNHLDGGGGSDTLNGAGGDDRLVGGAGGDLFTGFDTMASTGVDRILDLGAGDRIRLASGAFASIALGDGTGLTAGQAHLGATVDGVTSLHVGRDGTPGSDLRIELLGGFTLADFAVAGGDLVRVGDLAGPTLTASTPAPGVASHLPSLIRFSLEFDETVYAGSGLISVKQTTNGVTTTLMSKAATDSTFAFAGNKIFFDTPDPSFLSNSKIWVSVAADAVKDISGNFFSGISSNDQVYTQFLNTDVMRPTLVASTPGDGGTLGVGANLTLTFSEPVRAGLGRIWIVDPATRDVVASVWADAPEVTIAGSTVTIDLERDLPAGRALAVRVDPGAFFDAIGNTFAGIADTTTLNFTTTGAADAVAPTLVGATPSDGATGVALDAKVTLTFSEAVRAGDGVITLYDKLTGRAEAIYSVNSSEVTFAGATVTIDPRWDFRQSQQLAVKVTSDAVRDLAGNPFAGVDDATTLDFRTEDAPSASFSIAASAADKAEGDAGTTDFTFTITRAGPTAAVNEVTWTATTAGGAGQADAADFAVSTGVATFAAGETARAITVKVNGDTAIEQDESFSVALSNPTNGAVVAAGAGGSAGGVIRNDDIAPSLTIAGVTVDQAEGDAGTKAFVFSVTRAGQTIGVTEVTWTASTTGAAGETAAGDFAGPTTGTLTFGIGDVTKALTIDVAGDATVEPDERFTVTLSAPTGGATIATASTGAVIRNDDGAPSLSVAPLTADRAEGDAATTPYVFRVSRAGSAAGVNEATWTVSTVGGSGKADAADFAATTGTVTFAAGELARDVTVQVNGDLTVESDETFSLTLSGPTGGATLGTATADGTIRNDDVAARLAIAASSTGAADQPEGNAGATAFTYVVNRTGSTTGITTVDWAASTAGGAGQADAADFATAAGTLTFTAGEASQVITVKVAGDAVVEPDESFTVTLSNASNSGVIDVATANGVIRNDDGAPRLSVAASSADRAEGNAGTTPFVFLVSRAGPTTAATEVDWSVSTGGGVGQADAGDFGAVSGSVTFGVGETSRAVTVDVNGDTTAEADEAFTLTLANPSAGATIETGTASGVIRNDDGGGAISIAAQTADRAEGNSGVTPFTFLVSRPAGVSAAEVTWTATAPGGTGIADATDLSGPLSGVVTLGVGQTSAVVTIGVVGDAVAEANESFTVTLSNPTGGATLGVAAATGLIRDDDTVRITNMTGGPRPDSFVLSAGDDQVEGGLGRDVAVVFATRGATTVIALGSGGDIRVLLGGPQGNDTLINVERIRFTDQVLAFDAAGPAGQAYRLYQAAFARQPDRAGVTYWTDQLDNGLSLIDAARGFLAAPEFAQRYGASADDGQFVSQLYQNVLGRTPDAGGFQFWLGQLGAGRTRADLLVSFSESGENVARTDPTIRSGIALDLTAGSAAATQRGDGTVVGTNLGEQFGLTAASEAVLGGGGLDTATLANARAQIALAWNRGVGEAAVVTLSGPDGSDSLSGVERVRFSDAILAFDINGAAGQGYRLYRAAFAREPDAPGLGFHVRALDDGASLSSVAAGFLASPEFAARYGAEGTVSNARFVELLYQNVLGRAPDAGGQAFHLGNLERGTSRADVLIQFSESAENQATTLARLTDGIWFI